MKIHALRGGGSPEPGLSPLTVWESSGAEGNMAIRGRQCPMTPLLLPLLAAQDLAASGYLSPGWPSEAE